MFFSPTVTTLEIAKAPIYSVSFLAISGSSCISPMANIATGAAINTGVILFEKNWKVFVSGCDETFRVIDAESGKQLYYLPLGAYTGASAAVRDDKVYVGTFGNEVLGIDLGCRTSVVFIPRDVSCLWDKWTSFEVPARPKALLTMIDKARRVRMKPSWSG